MGTKISTIALLIGVTLTAAACGGGGSGGGKVTVTSSVDTTPVAEVPAGPVHGGILAESPLDTPENDELMLEDVQSDQITIYTSDISIVIPIRDVNRAHNDGYTGEGFDVYTTDGGSSVVSGIAPGANDLDFLNDVNDDIYTAVNDNDDFVGGIVTPEGTTDDSNYIRFDGEVGIVEAGAAALVWDKFDTVSGSNLESHIDNTRNTDGSLNLGAALAPAVGTIR